MHQNYLSWRVVQQVVSRSCLCLPGALLKSPVVTTANCLRNLRTSTANPRASSIGRYTMLATCRKAQDSTATTSRP